MHTTFTSSFPESSCATKKKGLAVGMCTTCSGGHYGHADTSVIFVLALECQDDMVQKVQIVFMSQLKPGSLQFEAWSEDASSL